MELLGGGGATTQAHVPVRVRHRRLAPITIASSTSLVSADERRLLDGLRAGNDAAFVEALRAYGPAMLRLARSYVGSQAVAERRSSRRRGSA